VHFFYRYLGSILILLYLTACQDQYPVDHEQLSSDERIVIRFSHIVGENTPKGLAARKFAELMDERSNGFVEVQVFPNGYLYKDGEEMDALLKGDLQMIAPATSKLTTLVPEWQVLDLPFAFENPEEVHSFLDGRQGQEMLTKLEAKGLFPLSIWDNGFKQMTNKSHPLIEPADFEGLKFRIMPSPVIKDQFLQLRSTTQSTSFNEVYQLLEQNVITGQENTFSNIFSKGIHSQQGYLTISNHGYLGYVVLMNKEFWEGLPPEIQTLIQEVMSEITVWERQIAKKLNQNNQLDLESCKCVEIHSLTDEEKQRWEEAFNPVYERFMNRFGTDYIKALPKYIGD
jgi:tripartite ATP-independent transporter DctP family solute receptor